MTEAVTRAERKQRTHQALLDSALSQLQERSFASLSLREVSRAAGIVPTAFYRHFDSMDDLGVALVDESMRSLRQMLREARRKPDGERVVSTVAILRHQVRNYEDHFRFVLREQHGGVAEVRRAIAAELRLFTSELATDLATMVDWRDPEDRPQLDLAADLMVCAMMKVVHELLDTDVAHEQTVVRKAESQLRLILIGMFAWRSESVS